MVRWAPALKLQTSTSASRGEVGSPSRTWPAVHRGALPVFVFGCWANVCPQRQHSVPGLAFAAALTRRARAAKVPEWADAIAQRLSAG